MSLVSSRGLERGLWVTFAVFFAIMTAAVYAPTEPFVGILPLWAVIALAPMLATIIVATIALHAGWPNPGDPA